MARLLSLLFIIFCFPLGAAEFPRHMVILSPAGIGGSGAYERITPGANSQFQKLDINKGNIALNYHYTLSQRFQIGSFFSNNTDFRKYKTDDGSTGEVEFHTLALGLSFLYNFSDELINAYYTGFIFTYYNNEEEFTHDGPFSYLEDDRLSQIYEIILGQRFSLKRLGLQNITYSPSFSLFLARNEKDYTDDGLDHSWGANFIVLKFDVLF